MTHERNYLLFRKEWKNSDFSSFHLEYLVYAYSILL